MAVQDVFFAVAVEVADPKGVSCVGNARVGGGLKRNVDRWKIKKILVTKGSGAEASPIVGGFLKNERSCTFLLFAKILMKFDRSPRKIESQNVNVSVVVDVGNRG